MATSPKRTFIGWNKPILQSATERLFREYAQDGLWDLRQWLIVLPSSLASRRLQELLALQAQASGCVLYPPEIVTVGQLPEHLYVARYPFASDTVQVLAWCRALQETEQGELENVLPLPQRGALPQQWLELGKMLAGVHRELASDGLNFDGVVKALGAHPEATRWRALSRVQERYLRVLDGLNLWDVQTARLVAIELSQKPNQTEITTNRQILMLSSVDLNRAQRGFLAAVADHVHAWVAAPAEWAEKFDEFGCLIGPAWEEITLDLPAGSLLVGNSPADQFELTAAALAELDEHTHARDITIGVPDATLLPLLEEHLRVAGADVRFGPGSPLSHSEPARLLQLIGTYLDNRNYSDWSSLVRHPVVMRLVTERLPELGSGWLGEVDRYYEAVLPRTIDTWIKADAPGAAAYDKIVQLVDRWLTPLGNRSRMLSDWSQPLLELMQSAYAEQACEETDEEGQRLIWACRCVAEQIMTLGDIPESLSLKLSASEAVDWLMHTMAGQLVPRGATRTAIEMLGWLDLTLDDASTLLITGMHDGVVPESVNADPFLPNQLRRQLGMVDNQRRYARDMYAFQVMLHSRERLRVIVGRLNLTGDPLVPSRLLLACDLAALPARVLRLTADENLDVPGEVRKSWHRGSGESVLPYMPPQADSSRRPPHLTVTAFRTYLSCPYRYYLKHVLHLKTIDDLEAELNAGQFGDLIHDTLHRMHKDPVGQSVSAEDLEQFLRAAVVQVAEERYGHMPAAAIKVQIAGAQDRLAVFAQKQAAHNAEGWQTVHTEVEAIIEAGQDFVGKKLPIKLLGRIDRIDYHPELKSWAIWDYKTSDGGKWPVQNHYNSRTETWTDLQLPLYRHIVQALDIRGDIQVGYILLPRSVKDIDFVPAKFTDEQLQKADEEAWRVIEAVAAGKYEPITGGRVDFDDFERICQVGVQTSLPGARPTKSTGAGQGRSAELVNRKASSAVVAMATIRLSDSEYPLARRSVAPALVPLMIRASAGTGKTYQLSNRLLHIILSGQNVDHVLATTFTRKAAGEILQRVLVRLSRACIDDQAFLDLQQALVGLAFDQADCLAGLRRVTRQLHRFRVSTLDSFYAQVARTFSLELHLSPGWSAIDPVREAAVRMQAIQRMLDQSDQRTLTSLVKMLSKGDTKRSVAAEIEDTVQGGYHYYRSATKDAFNNLSVPSSPPETEFREAIEFLTRYDPNHKNIKNAQDILANLATIGDWEGVVAHGLMKAAVESGSYYKRELAVDMLDRLAVLRRHAAAELLPIRRAQSSAAFDLLDSFNDQYMAILRRQRMLAFADITYILSRWMNPSALIAASQAEPLTLTAEAVEGKAKELGSRDENPLPLITLDQQQLMLRMDCGIDHLLLDEFQDTAPDQWRIIEPLAQPLTEQITPDQSFFCVGDTKQAIYGWRGGVAEIFDTVTSSVSNLTQQELSESYRSSPEVMEVVNAVFQYLPRHENFADCNEVARDWSLRFPTHKTTRSKQPGYVLVKNGIVTDSSLTKEERDLAELEYSADMIAELAGKAPGQSIGVLFRENRKVAMMIDLLRRRGVAASQEGGNPLTDSAAVQLLLSVVHLADHPGDSIAAFHVQHSTLAQRLPREAVYDPAEQGTGKTSKKKSHAPERNSTERNSTERNSSGRFSPGRLAQWTWHQVLTAGFGRTISYLCDLIAPDLTWWEQHRLTQLITLAYQFETQFTNRLRDFELLVEQQKVALPSEAAVKVMTIHSSKGLEFDAVFLPELGIPLSGHPPLMVARSPDPCSPPMGILRYMNEHVQTLLPKEWQQAFHDRKAQSVREILCVLYVAMTRARNALYMITAPRTSRQQHDSQSCESVLQSILGSEDQYKQAEAVLYERGRADWYAERTNDQHVAATELLAAPSAEVAAASASHLLTLRLDFRSETAPPRGLSVSAPSSLGTMSAVRLDRLFTVAESLGTAHGTLIHAWFEQITWLADFDRGLASEPKTRNKSNSKRSTDATVSMSDRLRIAAMRALTPEQLRHVSLEREVADFDRLLGLESVQTVLDRQRYQSERFQGRFDEITVENERRISLIVGDSTSLDAANREKSSSSIPSASIAATSNPSSLGPQLIDGTIDRLVVLKKDGRPVAAEIIDYKTDRLDSRRDIGEWTRERVERHRPQLRAYASVVSRLLDLPMEQIDCTLVLLAGDVCVRCDDHAPPAPHLKYKQLHLTW